MICQVLLFGSKGLAENHIFISFSDSVVLVAILTMPKHSKLHYPFQPASLTISGDFSPYVSRASSCQRASPLARSLRGPPREREEGRCSFGVSCCWPNRAGVAGVTECFYCCRDFGNGYGLWKAQLLVFMIESYFLEPAGSHLPDFLREFELDCCPICQGTTGGDKWCISVLSERRESEPVAGDCSCGFFQKVSTTYLTKKLRSALCNANDQLKDHVVLERVIVQQPQCFICSDYWPCWSNVPAPRNRYTFKSPETLRHLEAMVPKRECFWIKVMELASFF